MKTQSFRFTEEEIKKIKEVSKKTNRSRSYIVRTAIDNYLNEVEENEIALNRIQDPTDEVITSEEMDELI
ncbi:MAG: ribbon-helix-helix protein, CopG family [Elusimicrobiota bacterium]